MDLDLVGCFGPEWRRTWWCSIWTGFRDLATFEKPLQYSEVIIDVVVNGRVVAAGGKMTEGRDRSGRQPLSPSPTERR